MRSKRPAIGPEVPVDLPVLSVFAGAGGLDLGFQSAGFRSAIAIDIDPAAIATYKRNHPSTKAVQLDLASTDPTDIVNLWEKHTGRIKPVGIIGGPPCQGFSSSNLHQRQNDPRHRLLDSYANIVEKFAVYLGLDFFVLENVPGLVSRRHQRLFHQFKDTCEAAGFKVIQKILDAGRFGIPQHRKRLVVVGINRRHYPAIDFQLPEGDQQTLPIKAVLSDLPEPVFCTRGLSSSDIPFHPNHVTMVPRSPKFTNGSLKPGYTKGLSFKVLTWDSPSYTVAYGHNEVHVHPGCHRRLSVYEAMLLQGFPSWYQLEGTFSQQVQLVSDAVPPPLGEGIAHAIARLLAKNEGESLHHLPNEKQDLRGCHS